MLLVLHGGEDMHACLRDSIAAAASCSAVTLSVQLEFYICVLVLAAAVRVAIMAALYLVWGHYSLIVCNVLFSGLAQSVGFQIC